MRADKTETDRHWDERARNEADSAKVNIADLSQRAVENDFIFSNLSSSDNVLEVGCGNGYLTADIRQKSRFVDAFDFSESMIAAAKAIQGERNNRFFVHSVLSPTGIDAQYDKLVCVRVLINLAGLDEQKQAIENIARWVHPGGMVILVEGFQDGFDKLSALRREAGIPDLQRAAINYYSYLADLMPTMRNNFDVIATWNSGMFDLLTRVAYPLLVGPDEAVGPGDFHERLLPLARGVQLEQLAPYARLQGFLLKKR
jgi:SAM-dependent methyltransferase